LYDLFGITILPKHSTSPIIRFEIEGITGNMGAVLAADTGGFIDINPLLPQCTPQLGLKA
jgi:hypothetical protein